ncbi:MAG: hypothetical protein NTY14_03465 [Candidatus Omnitrophica bacterium]|nr:hypothetical protein [Candidatus Omnitrophota bacterium]
MKNLAQIILAIGVISMVGSYGCSKVVKYERYSSKDIEINMAMDYISGWLFSETRGAEKSYAQVVFYEPQRKDKNIKAEIVVTVQDSSKLKLDSSSVESFVDDLLSRREKLKDMKLLARAKNVVAGSEAISVLLSYKTIDIRKRSLKDLTKLSAIFLRPLS